MKQEDKDLLLKDICGRLPYGVKAYVRNYSKLDMKWYEGIYTIKSAYPYLNEIYVTSETGSVDVLVSYDDYEIKPYLFPLSSMTLEQKKELCKVGGYEAREEDCGYHSETFYYNMVGHENVFYPDADDIDWLNKNHFDYRGLIDKDLALDATGLNLY